MEQSWGQKLGSLSPQKPSPQVVQSVVQDALLSGGEMQTPSPQPEPQSLHVIGDSKAPHTPSPQGPQSNGQVVVVSPSSQRPLPQTCDPQSGEQLCVDSF